MDVKWAMASRFPWLEIAMNDAYAQVFKVTPQPITFSRSGGRLDPNTAGNVAVNFLSHPDISWAEDGTLQYPWAGVYQAPGLVSAPWTRNPPSPLPSSPEHEWVIVRGGPAKYEHARWLTGRYLSEVMGVGLLREDDWLAVEPGASEENRSWTSSRDRVISQRSSTAIEASGG
jgi:hypothetical protein